MKINTFFFWIIFSGITFSGLLASENDLLPGTIIDGDIMIGENEDPWPNVLKVNPSRSKARMCVWDLYVIREAILEIERGTCIKFVRRKHEKDYIYITPFGGCWSTLGGKEKKANFEMHLPEAENFVKFPYDYWSVMHYDAYAFSKAPKLPTMKPKKPNVRLRDLGKAKAIGVLTNTDREKLKALYECDDIK
ncbi:Astacin-like metalloendopeptidase like protein [Argiope bruennichi]|uniref:Astacin-like metalloendopeptidase like protein n=1 Tax=Argiope bruennichi TaxID=94029 RepID=A0A8T0FZU5_ARGBR|nr:Astacin-like metalloendopeptidase like protein [Argiope bruennichi]